MDGSRQVPGGAPSLFVAGGTPLLHAEEQVFDAMLARWRDQQASHNLHADTIKDRLLAVRRFQWKPTTGRGPGPRWMPRNSPPSYAVMAAPSRRSGPARAGCASFSTRSPIPVISGRRCANVSSAPTPGLGQIPPPGVVIEYAVASNPSGTDAPMDVKQLTAAFRVGM
jgi:hypothetical protein